MVSLWMCLLMIRCKQSVFLALSWVNILSDVSGIIPCAFYSPDQIFVLFHFVQKKKKSSTQSVRTQRSRWFSSRWPFVHTLHYICMVIGVYTDDTEPLFALCRHFSHAPYLFCWVASDALYLIETVCFLSFISRFHLYGMILSFSPFFSHL